MVTVRAVQDGDLPFIYSSWLSTYRDSRAYRLLGDRALLPYAKLVEPERASPSLYYALHKLHIATTLGHSAVLVAAYEEDPTVLLGYIVFEEGILHYVCVKQAYQGEGVAKLLVSHSGLKGNVSCTCVPDSVNLKRLGDTLGLTLQRR